MLSRKLGEVVKAAEFDPKAETKGSFGLTLSKGRQTATASIAPDAGLAAPDIRSSGSVSVLANAVIARGKLDFGLRNSASATIKNPEAIPATANDASETGTAYGFAIAAGQVSNTANAFIAPGATVSA